MSSNLVCNHTRDQTNRTPATRSSDFVIQSYDYRPNWTPLRPITIINDLKREKLRKTVVANAIDGNEIFWKCPVAGFSD